MFLNRKSSCEKVSAGVAVAVLVCAHLAAGALLCRGMCHRGSSLERMMKRAKRSVTGFVREIW